MNLNFTKLRILISIVLSLGISGNIQANIVAKFYQRFHLEQAARFVTQAIQASTDQATQNFTHDLKRIPKVNLMKEEFFLGHKVSDAYAFVSYHNKEIYFTKHYMNSSLGVRRFAMFHEYAHIRNKDLDKAICFSVAKIAGFYFISLSALFNMIDYISDTTALYSIPVYVVAKIAEKSAFLRMEYKADKQACNDVQCEQCIEETVAALSSSPSYFLPFTESGYMTADAIARYRQRHKGKLCPEHSRICTVLFDRSLQKLHKICPKISAKLNS